MADLFDAVGPLGLYQTSGVVAPGEEEFDLEKLVEIIGPQGEGRVPSLGLSVTGELLYTVSVGEGRILVRAERPVVQLRPCRPPDVGLELGYPQLYQDPVTGEIEKVTEGDRFPNTLLFKKIRRWVRHATAPRPGSKVRWGKNLSSRLN